MPLILIQFADDSVIWHSAGWGDDPDLLKAAKAAINKGETREEVIEFLTDAGFEVVEATQ